MMNQYPLWKHLLILAAVLIGALYALPNVFGEDPALQVSASRGASVDEALETRVLAVLEQADLVPKSTEREGGRLLVRFSDTETQLQAREHVRDELGIGYVVALNLAPSTPAWLANLGALPMYLGLDLRGGVHFLLEVDMEAAVRQAEERYVGDLRSLLRKEKVRYKSVSRLAAGSIVVSFRQAEVRDKAYDLIRRNFDDLSASEEEEGGE